MTQEAYEGYQAPHSTSGGYNALRFMIEQLLAEMHTATLVEVQSCSNAGGVSPVGTVDVKPLVNELDGSGKAIPHGTIFSIPYFRLQGGTNAFILDPEQGDIGIAIFAERDISSVKTNKAQSNPGSYRCFSWADGLYLGGVLNNKPTQYVRFYDGGIDVNSTQNLNVTAAADVTVKAAGTAIVQAATIKLQNAGSALKKLLNSTFLQWAEGHVHSNGNNGNDTGTPTTTPPSDSETSVVQAE